MADKHIVSIPGTEEALVKEAPPYNRGNFAYINVPGPYEKNPASVYYVAPPDPNWTRGGACRLHPRQGGPAVHQRA